MHAFRLLHLVLAYVEEINLYFIRFFFFLRQGHIIQPWLAQNLLPAGLKLREIHLLSPFKCWDERHVSPHLAEIN